ncbi:LacI family DNA-binding transcriptional regulator [Lactobacillus amylolyticus]|uniref:LacI family DNA-binding transcriptional regulator n=1 Tax=Lactobacillus amylolyticus TaxID=83683 RepID=UPI001F017223|nr:LacI family DNA-binding transcriptional regulator [Lactobacillus amylolyticus]
MTATIKELANEAGVSIATVSRFLNQNGYVGPNSASKIQSAIDKLGYKHKDPILTTKMKVIEVNFPNIDNPFYAELFQNLSTYLKEKDYDCILHLDHFHIENFDYFFKEIPREKDFVV